MSPDINNLQRAVDIHNNLLLLCQNPGVHSDLRYIPKVLTYYGHTASYISPAKSPIILLYLPLSENGDNYAPFPTETPYRTEEAILEVESVI